MSAWLNTATLQCLWGWMACPFTSNKQVSMCSVGVLFLLNLHDLWLKQTDAGTTGKKGWLRTFLHCSHTQREKAEEAWGPVISHKLRELLQLDLVFLCCHHCPDMCVLDCVFKATCSSPLPAVDCAVGWLGWTLRVKCISRRQLFNLASSCFEMVSATCALLFSWRTSKLIPS